MDPTAVKPTSRDWHLDRLSLFVLATPPAQRAWRDDDGAPPTAAATCALHQEWPRVDGLLR